MRRRIEWTVAVVFVLLVVLVIPVVSFDGLTGEIDAVPELQAPDVASVFSMGTPFVVSASRVLPVSSLANGIAPREDESDILPNDTLEVFLIAGDGAIWVVDRPAHVSPSARIRVFGDDPLPQIEFLVPSGAALYAPAHDGGLWVGFAQGETGTEVVRHYSAEGEVLGEYVLPSGVLVRSLSVAPTGELWAQVEESEVDLETYASTYRSHILPVAIGTDLSPAEDPVGSALEGNFIGFDGRLYSLTMESVPQGGESEANPSVLSATDANGIIETFQIPAGYRPFAADLGGRVYCESRSAQFSADFFRGSIGEGAFGARDVLVLDDEGVFAVVPVSPLIGANTLAPVVQVDSAGRMLSVSREGESVRFFTLTSGNQTSIALADAALTTPDLGLIGGIMPASGDPYRALDDVQRDYMRLVYAGLVRRDEALAAVPDLAVTIPAPGAGVSDDGLTITYELREDLTWHDGVPVSGEDIVATWQYLKVPVPTPRGNPFPGFDRISDVSASGRIVTVVLTEPFGAGPESFFPYVLPAHLIDPTSPSSNAGLWSAPIGCGPYRLTRWEADGLWQLEAHDASPRGAVSIDTIHVRFAESEGALLALQMAQVPTVWSWVDPFMLSDLRRDAVGELERWPTGRWIGLLFNENADPLADIDVRKALISAYPIQELKDSILDVSVDDVEPSLFSGVRAPDVFSGLRPPHLDIRKIDEPVEYSGGLRMGWPEIAYVQLEDVPAAWGAVGIPIRRSAGVPNFYESWLDSGLLTRGNHEIAAGVFPSLPDAGWGGIFDPFDVPSQSNIHGVGVGAYDDSRLRELYADAAAEYDAEVRRELSDEIQERLTELSAFMFERAEYRYSARVGTIEGFSPAPYPAGDFWNIESWTLPGGDGR